MIINNITYSIDRNLEHDFLSWLKSVHIPEIMLTGKPKSNKIMRLLTEVENAGSTFSIQFSFEKMEDFIDFENEFLDYFNNEVAKKYNGHYVFFPSLLEEI